MLRKYLMAGMALALVAGPALFTATAARADHRDDNDNGMNERYYIIRDVNGSCRIRLSQRFEVLGQYRSRRARSVPLPSKERLASAENQYGR